jgi:hypothetical protein
LGLVVLGEAIGQRLQAFFSGDGGAGAALGLVGQIQVFEFCLLGAGLNLGFQFLGQLALVGNGFQNGLLAVAASSVK